MGRALAAALLGGGGRPRHRPGADPAAGRRRRTGPRRTVKLAARVRVLSVGHGRKSDHGDAVSVAVAARSVSSLRQVGVEDQAVVLHLLAKRRQFTFPGLLLPSVLNQL